MLKKWLMRWMEQGDVPRDDAPPVAGPSLVDPSGLSPREHAPLATLADPGPRQLRKTQSNGIDWRIDYPSTFLVADENREHVFDPALKQYARAFRLGDPAFADDADRLRWHAARAAVVGHVLRVIARSPWRDSLVLRGSTLLRAFLGDAARAPGDIDWVVLPADLAADADDAVRMLDDIARRLADDPHAGAATIDVSRAARDAIWTYARAEGVRLAFVWIADGLPPGTMQMDFVFRETLPVAPVETSLPAANGTLSLLGATPELSLAWKLLWLDTDAYPQGKDLYDAVLLAETTSLPPRLLAEVFVAADVRPSVRPPGVGGWDVDWDNFKLEYPWVDGSVDEWKRRLSAALASDEAG
ncbi:MAG TPA: nucleotidyl transferase AbiEii/AbiGii toxin family protein [Tahibacter sp.]|nr:nucleotidyl transferase AbiEii/AbiGii toxin family protein [Tahibacter sp.]